MPPAFVPITVNVSSSASHRRSSSSSERLTTAAMALTASNSCVRSATCPSSSRLRASMALTRTR